jgi:DNA polymerase
MTDDAAHDELRFLTRALRAHLEWQSETGATGLERAARDTSYGDLAARAQSSASVVAAIAIDQSVLEPAPPKNDAKRSLEVLAEAVRGCTRCALSRQRKQTVFARGNGSSGVCFVGEGPGADEDAQGLPFVGAAGQLLDKMIAAMGIARDDVYVCNVVKCRPPDNRKPELEELAACMPYLEEQLELIAPKVVVALGATAVQGLLGTTESITRLRGKWKTFRGQIPLMPTFHPAYLLRTPGAKREVWEDLQEVLRHIGRSAPGRR